MPRPEQLRTLADLLDDDAVYDLVAGAMTDARDSAPRHSDDRDSSEVLDHVITVLRKTADAGT